MSGSLIPDSEPVEETLPTAEIIPFPVRTKPAEPRLEEPQSGEPRPEDRLAKALASLNAALAEQKAALAAWREALGALQASTGGLGQSLQRYQSSLGTLAGNVNALRDKAVSLEQWADGVLTQ
jgi:hypothetical protein